MFSSGDPSAREGKPILLTEERPMSDVDSTNTTENEASEEEAQTAPEGAEAPSGSEPDLMSALEDFKGAAHRLLGQALSEDSLQSAAREAERTLGQVAAVAEPVARQIGEELARVGRDFGASLTDAIRSKTRPVEPPHTASDDSAGDEEPTDDDAINDDTKGASEDSH